MKQKTAPLFALLFTVFTLFGQCKSEEKDILKEYHRDTVVNARGSYIIIHANERINHRYPNGKDTTSDWIAKYIEAYNSLNPEWHIDSINKYTGITYMCQSQVIFDSLGIKIVGHRPLSTPFYMDTYIEKNYR